MRFTDYQIKNLKPKEQRYDMRENMSKGFAIRVFPNGTKTWVFIYKINGRLRRMTLGPYPALGLAEARTKYLNAYSLFKLGKDPAYLQSDEKKKTIESMTVKDLIDEYMEKWSRPRKKSWKYDKRTLEKELKPWFHRKAHEITRRDVVILLEAIQKRAPIMANRTLSVTRKMFNFAVDRDILKHSPCVSMKAPSPERRSERFLKDWEISVFWYNFEASELVRYALQLQLITGQRKTEILEMKWEEIDLEDGWWRMPLYKAKNNEIHRVPLTDMAKYILYNIKFSNFDPIFVFPSLEDQQPIRGTSLNKAIDRNRKIMSPSELIAAGKKTNNPISKLAHFTPRALRHTAATFLAALGTNRFILSKILNHKDQTVTGIYDEYDYAIEKKQALEIWANKLKKILTASSVASD